MFRKGLFDGSWALMSPVRGKEGSRRNGEAEREGGRKGGRGKGREREWEEEGKEGGGKGRDGEGKGRRGEEWREGKGRMRGRKVTTTHYEHYRQCIVPRTIELPEPSIKNHKLFEPPESQH